MISFKIILIGKLNMGVCFSQPAIRACPERQKLIIKSQISNLIKLTGNFLFRHP